MIKISIIIPIYNAERFLLETLSSVSAQTHRNWEALLIIDPKSTDQSETIAQNWANQEPRARVVKNTIGGVSANRNLGIEKSGGDYICFLDSDDVWLPQKLGVQLSEMEKAKATFSAHDYELIDENSKPLNRIRKVGKLDKASLYKDNTIGCSTVMIFKSSVGDCRFKDELNEDFAFWLRLMNSEGFSAAGLSKALTKYRKVSNSRSSHKLPIVLNRINLLRDQENLSAWKLTIAMTKYVLRNILRLTR